METPTGEAEAERNKGENEAIRRTETKGETQKEKVRTTI